ncbi:MAG: hypothetical protein ACLFTT_15475 [Candidatus Hydrogenedentota bacterium]
MIDNEKQPARQQILLTEYQEAMASQRDNTRLVYSWTGNIVLILSTGLFVVGARTNMPVPFFAAMALAILLMAVWWGMTETFVGYIVQRIRRIAEIEEELGMRLMSSAGEEIRRRGWKGRFLEARTYIRGFLVVYLILWGALAIFKFAL